MTNIRALNKLIDQSNKILGKKIRRIKKEFIFKFKQNISNEIKDKIKSNIKQYFIGFIIATIFSGVKFVGKSPDEPITKSIIEKIVTILFIIVSAVQFVIPTINTRLQFKKKKCLIPDIIDTKNNSESNIKSGLKLIFALILLPIYGLLLLITGLLHSPLYEVFAQSAIYLYLYILTLTCYEVYFSDGIIQGGKNILYLVKKDGIKKSILFLLFVAIIFIYHVFDFFINCLTLFS